MPLLVKFNLAADWAARGFTFETAMALARLGGGHRRRRGRSVHQRVGRIEDAGASMASSCR